MVQSQRGKELDAYLQKQSPVGKWPLEIGGRIERYDYYKFPIDRLIYNVNNGRLEQWKGKTGRTINR